MTLAELIKNAEAATDNFNTASVFLKDGSQLFCSVRRRAANSRGANRGKHHFVEFNLKLDGAPYSKRVPREIAGKLLAEGA